MPPRTGAEGPGGAVGIVGLGLIGGSLARDLAARGVRVLAADRDPAALRAARAEGTVAAGLDRAPDAVWPVDLLVIAVPVHAAPGVLAAALPHLPPGCAVTDVGSTKRGIAREAERLGAAARFVGSHPMAGDHASGWSASRLGLFRGARVYLCPERAAPEAVAAVRALWTSLEAIVEEVDPLGHDERLAWASHLPQLAATALAGAAADAGLDRPGMGPGGRDMTRLAGSSPEMWTGICLENADALDRAVGAMADRLEEIRRALRERDGDTLQRLLEAGRSWFEEGTGE